MEDLAVLADADQADRDQADRDQEDLADREALDLEGGPGWGFGPGSIPVGAFGPGGYAERTGAPGVADDANYNWRRPYGNWWQTLRHYLHELKLAILGPDPPKLHRHQ